MAGEYAYTCEDCRWTAALDPREERAVFEEALGHFERTGHSIERVCREHAGVEASENPTAVADGDGGDALAGARAERSDGPGR